MILCALSINGPTSVTWFGVNMLGRRLEFAELVRLFIACIAEDTGLNFIHHSPGNHLAGHNMGDWTYEFERQSDNVALLAR